MRTLFSEGNGVEVVNRRDRMKRKTFALEVLTLGGEIPWKDDKNILVVFGKATRKQKTDLAMILKV